MNEQRMVIIGLTITSSWGNGHATTYRALLQALAEAGHDVLFLEREAPWYAANRDLPHPPYGKTELYQNLDELRDRFGAEIRRADLVMVGSYVRQGIEVGRWVNAEAGGITAFYDIDTPVTLASLMRGDCAYLATNLIPDYDLYLSFTGGPTLLRLEDEFGAAMARPLYCSADAERYRPQQVESAWDLGYLGTYSPDRQAGLDQLLLEPARRWSAGRFTVAGPQFPATVPWPANVHRIEHLPPGEHPDFYSAQRFTLNVTRADMVRCGWSPSVRLFEAAACGTPIISDWWEGLGEVFSPGQEILVSSGPGTTLSYLRDMSESARQSIGRRARERVLRDHTARHRVQQLEGYLDECRARPALKSSVGKDR
jgi:spore maturation protein CgeB